MRRVCILGGSGAGKSTLCRRLAARLELPAIHLDQLWWQPGWREPELEPFLQRLSEALEQPGWVMDGNFADFLERRLPHTDTVIWLDYPTWLCLWRVIRRIWQSHGRVRSDMGEGCPEKWDLGFLWFVACFRRSYRPRLLRALRGWQGKLHHFKHPRELENWWQRL